MLHLKDGMFPPCTGKRGNRLLNPSDPGYWVRTARGDVLARAGHDQSESIADGSSISLDHSKTVIHGSSGGAPAPGESSSLFGDMSLLHWSGGSAGSAAGGVDPTKMNQRLNLDRKKDNKLLDVWGNRCPVGAEKAKSMTEFKVKKK